MTNKYQEQWMDTAPGRATDPDGVAGFQCVDTVKDYFMAIFGLSWWKGWPGAGNAKDMLYTFDGEYFDRILNDPNDPNLIPQRGDIIVWGGTAANGPNPYGHIAVVLSATVDNVTVIQQDGYLQCPMYVGTLPYYLPTAGSVTGWLRPKFDDDPIVVQPQGDVVLAPNQRRAGSAAVNERAEPNTSSAIVRLIPAGSLEVWDGFVHGETVDLGNGAVSDLWLKDAQGYASALLFDPTNVDGLPDLTPKADPPVLGNERVTGSSGAIRRSAPDKSSTALETFMPDRILTFSGFVHGTDPYGDGNNVWFVGITGGYFWSGAFLDMGTHDLRDLTPATPPANVPAEVYDFDLDVLEVNGIKVEKVPADITNLQRGNFVDLADLKDFICHWWDDPAKRPVIEGVVSEFHRPGSLKSVQFVVNDKRVVQMVKIGDRAYHATASNGNMIGIEIDPRAADPNDPAFEAIWDNVRALRAAIEAKLGHGMTPHLHKDTPGNVGKTSCSGLDLANLTVPVPAPAPAPAPEPQPEPAPAPEPAPTPAPEPVPAPPAIDPGEMLMRFFRWLVDLFLVSQKK